MNLFRLDKKVAVVTGGGSGIGQAIAMCIAAQGAEVHILELNKENADETVRSINDKGGKAWAYNCNVAQQNQVLEVLAKINNDTNGIDILINSAGVSHVGTLEQTSEGDMDRVYQVNIKGVYNCMLGAIGHMKAKGKGVILNIASIASSVALADRFAYSMSKGAVLTMTYSVAKDYIKDNIRCNCISPARVHTPFVDGYLAANYPGKEAEQYAVLSATQPIGRMAKPEEIASLALFLCSEEAGFITGSDYPIDGGFIKLNS